MGTFPFTLNKNQRQYLMQTKKNLVWIAFTCNGEVASHIVELQRNYLKSSLNFREQNNRLLTKTERKIMALIPGGLGWGGSPWSTWDDRLGTWGGGRGFGSDLFGDITPWGGFGNTMMTPRSLDVMAPNMLSMDIRETPSNYDIMFDVPGVSKDDVNITVDDNRRTATISAEQKREFEDTDNWSWRTRERSFGKAARTILLPFDADPKNVEVKYDAGVIHMMFPKSESLAGRRLEIQ